MSRYATRNTRPRKRYQRGARIITTRRETDETRTTCGARPRDGGGDCDGAGAGEHRSRADEDWPDRRSGVHGETLSPADAGAGLQHVLAARCGIAEVDCTALP